MRKIPLTRGQFALVDDEDYERFAAHKWYAAKQPNTWYACRDIRVNGKKKTLWMHREINGTPDGFKTDHRDGDGLNNRRKNLRTATHQDNMINNARWKEGAPKYRGVSWHKRNNRWYAQITVDSKNIYIGSFVDQEDARRAYESAKEKYRAGKHMRQP